MTLVACLVVNPLAGLGGTVALKGSDGVAELALALGANSRVPDRVGAFFECLGDLADKIDWLAGPGIMGADYLPGARNLGDIQQITSADDTKRICRLMLDREPDLLVFAGGDGTARDLVDALGARRTPLVLGIPCGVKMHSGVFAASPASAAALMTRLLAGDLLSVSEAQVRDIDEAALRLGQVNSRYYGALPVPDDLRYLQRTKVGGLESDRLVMEEIAADFRDHLADDCLYLMGAGTTIAEVMASLGLKSTLLGVDAVRSGRLVAADLTEARTLELVADQAARIVVSFGAGQGYLFGRGNQQLSARVIEAVGVENILVLSTKSKLKALDGRTLLVDTGDRSLDERLSGLIRVRTGYDDEVLYLVEAA